MLVSGGVMSLNPSVVLQSGETYRVHGHYSANIAEGNRIIFTYAPAILTPVKSTCKHIGILVFKVPSYGDFLYLI